MRRLADVEALAAGRLQLVDLLLVLRERRRVDLDAGRLLEIRDHGIGQFVVPVDDVERARGRQRVGDDAGEANATAPSAAAPFRNERRENWETNRLWVERYISKPLRRAPVIERGGGAKLA